MSFHCCFWLGCSAVFFAAEELAKHLVQRHADDAPVCHWKDCRSTIAHHRRESMIRHLQVHTELKQHRCVKYQRCFKRKPDLIRHDRLLHSAAPYAAATSVQKVYLRIEESRLLAKEPTMIRVLSIRPC